MIIEHYEQRTDEWHAARCGCITMSNAQKLITGGGGKTRRSYLLDVVAERITGRPTESYKSWAMERGIALEPFAFRAYCSLTDLPMDNIGLAYLDKTRTISCSPDGICGHDGGVEIKCPEQRAHMRFLDGDTAPREHMAQIQGAMWITCADWWDFVSFCPEFRAAPLAIHRVERDSEMIAQIADSALRAVVQIDAMEAAIRRISVADNTLKICDESLGHLEMLKKDNDGEVDFDE